MTKEEIGSALKAARESARFTQSQVASIIGKTQQTIANWESGAAQPDANTLFVLCDLYKISIDDTFGGGRNVKVTSDEMAIISHYRALDTYGKDAVNAVVDAEYRRCTEMGSEVHALIDLFAQASPKTRERAISLLSEDAGQYRDELGEKVLGNMPRRAKDQIDQMES